ncbi:ERF family protein [Streptomyces sp. NPDC050529]|uniref:ERF family protein n=1 Tax=Streptomyces sp. NPDC050529 TaxID=3365624 RepID=UPI003792B42C
MTAVTEALASTTAEGPTSHTQNPVQPSIHQLMALVMRDVRDVGKNGFNDHQKYKFRGVDDFIGALAQPLRDHGVFMMTEILDFQTSVRGKMNAVHLRVAFHFYGPAGDKVTATTLGEASDTADKASNKAMSAALKYALMQTFMIPVDAGSLDDGDRDHPEAQSSPADAYMERLRKAAVWNNVTALLAMHAEAKGDGLLESQVHGPSGETTLGALLVARGKQLKEEVAAREERQAQEAPAAAAQVAAEHGVGPDVVDQLMAQVQRNWNDALELTKDMAEATRRNVALTEVDGPHGGMVQFGAMVTARIAELKEQARQAELNGHTPERSAA